MKRIIFKKIDEGYKDVDLDKYMAGKETLKDVLRIADKTKKYKQYTITYEEFDEKTKSWLSLWGEIKAFDTKSGNEVANSTFGDDNGRFEATIDVHPEHQRRGLATVIYDWIEEIEGKKLSRGFSQSDDAKAFWTNREKRGKISEKANLNKKDITGLENKADEWHEKYKVTWKTMFDVIKQVFERGIGAYFNNKGSVRAWVKATGDAAGSRIWAYARVNAFLEKSKKTHKTADKDLMKILTDKAKDDSEKEKLKKEIEDKKSD